MPIKIKPGNIERILPNILAQCQLRQESVPFAKLMLKAYKVTKMDSWVRNEENEVVWELLESCR
jgi:hypothetical protein